MRKRAAGQFGERVMRDGFAAIQEKRDFVTAENARERLVITVQLPDQHGAIAKTVLLLFVADKFQDFARGKHGLGFRIRAGDYANARLEFTL